MGRITKEFVVEEEATKDYKLAHGESQLNLKKFDKKKVKSILEEHRKSVKNHTQYYSGTTESLEVIFGGPIPSK